VAGKRKSAPSASNDRVATYKHSSKRKNVPLVGIEAHGVVRAEPKLRYEYNPHLPPVLRSAFDAAEVDRLPELLHNARQRPLTEEEAHTLAAALRRHEPWLEWSGKREKPWFEVDPVALHIHERISAQAILRVLARDDVQRDLFADPQQSYAQAVQFYQHDVDWSNRMILGDSLQVMASLIRREDLAGRVQMIYIDPPYGIKFSSNFQPELGGRYVKDREQDLTREPEMVRAYRDTWTLGLHSYLTYLRDRIAIARELLTDSGSVFLQINEENVHRARILLDEVFGAENAVVTIVVKKKGATTPTDPVNDYLLWYAKDSQKVRVRRLTAERGEPEDDPKYNTLISPYGEHRRVKDLERAELSVLLQSGWEWARVNYPIVSQDPHETRSADYEFRGKSKTCGSNKHWRFEVTAGLDRLGSADRLFDSGGQSLGGIVRWKDWPRVVLSNFWDDTKGEENPIYIVQTAWKVVQRCLLMTTDPGDLVLDPTCGSGTTAYVAEQWGRRWITCDTSRVALALARQRLMTARFSYYQLRPINAEDVQRNPNGTWLTDPTGQIPGKGTFKYKTVPHITLKSIARNTSLDPIFTQHEPILEARLHELNKALKHVPSNLRQKFLKKLAEKKKEGKRSVTEADRRRWNLPETAWQEWEVPFDTDPEWPKPLSDALTAYRAAWRAKMDEVNAAIAANAETEELVDKPEEMKGVVRVSGPFTMEGVISLEEGPDTPIGGAPGDLETFENGASDLAVTNAEAHLDKILRLLKASGVDFAGNQTMRFSRLDLLAGASLLHAEGEWMNGDKRERRVAVSIGPEVGNVTAFQVEEAIRMSNRKGYDDVVFAGFGFDAAAQAIIEESSHPHVRLHMALIRPDIAMGDLLKTQPGSQLFTVFSAPRVKQPERQADGHYVIEVEGMDVYDPVSNTLFPTNRDRIAAWFLDSDYDGRTFCITQAFFPDKGKWDKLAKALGDTGLVEREAFAGLSGWRSLPFPRSGRLGRHEPWRIAVKVIDLRGNEGLRVLSVDSTE
jgi:adenine-specific DNA-methyltransferase